MNSLRYIFTVFMVMLMFVASQGQIFLPKDFMGIEHNGEIHLRWEPSSIDEWRAGLERGYEIIVYKNSEKSIPVMNKLVRPWSLNRFTTESSRIDDRLFQPYETSMSLIHLQQSGNSEMLMLLESLQKTSDQTVDSFRLSLLSFYSSLDLNLAEANALGVNLGKLPIDEYTILIKVKDFPPRELVLDMRESSNGRKINPPKLQAEWGDQVVNMNWNIEKAYEHYFGYFIEKSVNGKPFQRIAPLPILDPSVGMEGSKQLNMLQYADSFELNYVETRYRIFQVDYFGHVSKKYSEVKGYGFIELKVSPIITLAEQTKDNHAHLEWTMRESDIPLAKDFSIWRSKTAEGEYEEVVNEIPINQREAYIPMGHEVNFFRVELNPKDGKPLSTMPVFVMGMDTIAPATPVMIGATIDTLGQAVIKWHANTEEDLWGYRIFKANFSTNEYSLLNASPTLDTVFIDSVSLVNGADSLYYIVQAADDRNNRSDFTEPVALVKPDIVPPSAPFVRNLWLEGDSILLDLGASGSPDVVFYELYRKKIREDKGWTLLKVLDTILIDSIFVDIGVEPGKSYAYTLRAKDESGLISEFAKLKILNTPMPEVKFEPFASIETIFNQENGEVTISWDVNDKERFKSVLVYRGTDGHKIGKYKFVDAPEMSITERVPSDGKVFYKLKPTFEDQKRPYMSDVIIIDVDSMQSEDKSADVKQKKRSKRKRKRN